MSRETHVLNDMQESQELKETKMSEVVGQFSTSKWKPVEKSDSNNSSEHVKKESSDLSHVSISQYYQRSKSL